MLKKHIKILVVAPEYPYPANDGGKVDVFRRLQTLYKIGYEVDFLYTSKARISNYHPISEYCDEIYYTPKILNLKYLFSMIPFQVLSRKSLKNIQISKDYDWILLEGDHVSEVLLNKKIKTKNGYLLRVNNIERDFFFEQFKGGFPSLKSIYALSESIKYGFYSSKIYKLCKYLLFVSSKELETIERKYKVDGVHLLSHYAKENAVKRPLNSKKILFIGSLTLPSNVEGLKWYLNNIHPLLQDIDDYEFIVAGSTNPKESRTRIEDFVLSFENVKIYTNLSDLDDMYEQCSIFVNPVQRGAGIKVKSINAIQNGLPLVSTSIGIEGMGVCNEKHVLIADSIDKFEKNIRRLLDNKELREDLSENAQMYFSSINHEDILSKILEK